MKHTRRASALVFYKKSTNQIYKIVVTTKYEQGFSFELLSYEISDKIQPYKYESFQYMYKTVLRIMKQNNFAVYSYPAFGTIFYDILWYNIENGELQRFGLNGE